MILFAPFRNEVGLILDGKTNEEAIQLYRNDNDSPNVHHDNLQNLLGAEKNERKYKTPKKYCSWRSREAEVKNRDDDEPQLLGEIMDAVNDIADINNNVTLDPKVAMLNSNQKIRQNKATFNKTKATGGFVK